MTFDAALEEAKRIGARAKLPTHARGLRFKHSRWIWDCDANQREIPFRPTPADRAAGEWLIYA